VQALLGDGAFALSRAGETSPRLMRERVSSLGA